MASLGRSSRSATMILGLFMTPSRISRYARCSVVHSLVKRKYSDFTSDRYNVTRKNFTKLTPEHVAAFRSFLTTDSQVMTADLDGFNTDWLRTVKGQSQLVLKPRTTEEASAILSYCSKNGLAVCPQGGNTGLVGGSVPVFDEVIISTSLMNKIVSVDENSGIATCQAGVVLEQLDSYLAEKELMVPLDLGAKGSCQLGGNVATNAGGLRLLRYGSLRGNVLGLEVVLPSGEILDGLSTLRKDNTGYDLKQLFIGSEGSLGLITGLSILCPPRPKFTKVALLGVPRYSDVLSIFRAAKQHLGETLSAYEFMDADCRNIVCSNLSLRYPIKESEFYVVAETSGSNEEHDQEKMDGFLEDVMGSGLVEDGTVAMDSTQLQNIWGLRERIAEGLIVDGYTYKYDISLPLDCLYDIVDVMRERLKGTSALRCCGYGHVGDGNLHLNITSAQYDEAVLSAIEPFLYQWTSEVKGSISAEHGLGFKKKQFIHYSKSDSAIRLMHKIKALLDPQGIMNPYKTLPDP